MNDLSTWLYRIFLFIALVTDCALTGIVAGVMWRGYWELGFLVVFGVLFGLFIGMALAEDCENG